VLAYWLTLGWNGAPTTSQSSSPLRPLLFIVAGACVGALLLPGLRIVVTRSRTAFEAWRGRRRRIQAAATAERRARAMMSELCPHGWRARITLYEGQSGRSAGHHGEEVRGAVALDWFELRAGGGEPAVMRRVWAETIGEALEAMVSDRRTDETLEQIELRASANGALWPDL
jgi:hypothetical protein